jgi:phage terminase large subunit GpA-like protein
MAILADSRFAALLSLIPPPRVALSSWIEGNVRLPEGVSALPGPIRLHAFQRGIADAIGDGELERVTIVKCVRIGFTTLLTATIGHFCSNDPCPVLVLQPTESDCRIRLMRYDGFVPAS